jgi:serine/threonine-protein kinase RsbW
LNLQATGTTSLKVNFETLGRTTLAIAQGRLDFGAAAGFQKQIEQALVGKGTAPAVLIVDCAALDYVSSAGLRVFLLSARAAQRAGITFALCALQPAVREVFEVSGFSRIMAVHADRPTALAHTGTTSVNERRTYVPGDAAQLPVLARFLQEFWSAASLPPAQSMNFELALEETFTNVVMHGSPPGPVPHVEVSLVFAAGRVTLTIEDNGAEFDPLTLPQPDIQAKIGDRRVGGLGVFLVRQMMDAVSYQRIGLRNQLRMSKHIEGL